MTVAPETLTFSATKPNLETSSLFLTNLNAWALNGTAAVRDASLSTAAANALLVDPSTFVVLPGGFVQLSVTLSSPGLQARDYAMAVDIDATSPQSVGVLPIHQSVPAQITILAKADAGASRVNVSGSPILKEPWTGILVTPYDSDGFKILTNHNERFEVALRSGDLAGTCSVAWEATRLAYATSCTVPDAGGEAGNWWLNVTLEGVAVLSSIVRVRCPAGFYEHCAVCSACPVGTTCAAGTTLATLQLNAGYWRSGAHSFFNIKTIQVEC